MFSSEQKLSINGENKEELQKAFEFAFALDGSKNLPQYYSTEEGKFIFYTYDPKNDKVYKTPPNASIDTLVNIVWDFLKSPESRNFFTEKQDDIDGSTYLGWQIFIPRYADVIPGASWYSLLGVKHDWIYYHK